MRSKPKHERSDLVTLRCAQFLSRSTTVLNSSPYKLLAQVNHSALKSGEVLSKNAVLHFLSFLGRALNKSFEHLKTKRRNMFGARVRLPVVVLGSSENSVSCSVD